MGKKNKFFQKNFGDTHKNFTKNRRVNHRSKFNQQHVKRVEKHNALDKCTREYVTPNKLKENQVGITEYITSTNGFTAVVKARYSDFQVNEINCNGKVVELTDFTIPKPKEDDILEPTEEIKAILTPDVWNKIDQVINKSLPFFEIDVTPIEKDMRTKIHKCIKQKNLAVNSSTINHDDKKFIKITKSKGNHSKRTNWTWDGDYVHFVLHKENVDTQQAASELAIGLRMKAVNVNYAGTKDKRAKSSQMFCLKKREPAQIVRAIRKLPHLKIGNFEFNNKIIKLGDLQGNRFKIALRHVDADNDKIEELLQDIKSHGFINYYGLQRFGNHASIPTYDIGIALLKREYKTACELILKPRDDEPEAIHKIREHWWINRNAEVAAKMFTNNKFIEKKLLDALAQCDNFANALQKIPRNTLFMYTHSFQSLVWNKIVSRRIKEYGLKLIPGDLIYREENLENMPTDMLEEPLEDENSDGNNDENSDGNNDENNDETNDKNNDDCDNNIELSHDTEHNVPETSVFKDKVRPLTQDDIDSGKYTIFDLILPLPGHDIKYPSNDIGKWYEEMLASYDLSSEKLHHKVKVYSLGGAYRKVLVKPNNMSWEFKMYNSPQSNLIASDYDIMKGIASDESIPEGKFKALILNFILPSSSYATMFLREILKSDTSSSNQAEIAKAEMEKHINKQLEKENIKTVENEKDLNIENEIEKLSAENINKRSIEHEEESIEITNDEDVKKLKLS